MTPVWWYRKRFFFIVASLSTCLRLFCSSVTWGRYLGKFHSYSHSFSDILFPFPFLSNNAVSWLPGSFQAAPHMLRNTTPLHIINLSKNHLFPIALDRKKKKCHIETETQLICGNLHRYDCTVRHNDELNFQSVSGLWTKDPSHQMCSGLSFLVQASRSICTYS